MYEVNKLVKTKGICKFCGKPAALLCDMPKNVGVEKITSSLVMTCDNEICPSCSTKFRGFDFCPECMRELRDVWNNKIKKSSKEEHK